MLTLACSSCQKKLAVQEDLAGKKIKCPICGAVTAVPQATPAGVNMNVGNEEARKGPLTPGPDTATVPPTPGDLSEQPTNPPRDRPEATIGARLDSGHDVSLIDFLAPPQAADELGRLGKYRILKILGHGGMGVVYKGEDLNLKRTVAIKAMLPTLAVSASSGKRFRREAEAMAAVEHDHIVRIYQIDEERGIPFMAMEFLKGEPLDERLRRNEPVPVTEILRIGREIAEGLGAAHTTGLIHRDIKPGNIWLEAPRNRVKILDFGLARAATKEATLTQQGAIIGTPAFMAPEQARGGDVDGRCDLFSLGVVLYRMCTGRAPFHGNDTVSTLMAVAMNEPTAPIKLNGELPAELSDLVMKLLEKDPAVRMGSAAEVVQAILALETKLVLEKMQTEKTEALNAGDLKQGISARRAAGPSPFELPSEVLHPKPAPKPVVKADGASSRKMTTLLALAGVAACALFCLVGLGGGVFYWQTNNGTVKIEINDPDIQVAFDKDAVVFKDGGKQENLTVRTGEHGLHVKRGDLEFDTEKPIVIKRGDVVTLRIEWLKKGKLVVIQGDKVIGAIDAPKPIVAVVPPVSRGEYALLFETAPKSIPSVEVPTLKFANEPQVTVEAWVIPMKDIQVGMVAGMAGELGLMGNIKDWGFGGFAGKEPGKGFIMALKGPIQKDRRVHLAGVRDGDRLSLYVDGKKIGEASQPKLRFNSTAPFVIGSAFVGIISEVRVSKTARYDRDFTPVQRFAPDRNTLALYNFDEGAGDKLADSSGNNHHGKIAGAKWVKADGTPVAPIVAVPRPAPAALLYSLPFKARWQPGFDANSWVTGFSSDGRLFLAAGDAYSSGNVPIWESATGRLRQELVPKNGVWFSNAKFLPGGSEYIVAAYQKDKDLFLWEIVTGKIVRKFVGHGTDQPDFALSPNGKLILSWADDKTLRLWEVDTGIEMRQLKGHTDKAAGVFSPDGTQILTYSPDQTLRLWEVESGKELKKLEGHTGPCSGAFSPNGKQALSYSIAPNVRLWDLESGKEIRKFAVPKGAQPGKTGNVMSAAFVADGRLIAGRCSDQKFRLWETASGKLVREIDGAPFGVKDDYSMTASPDGRLGLTGHIDGSVRVFDLESGKEIHSYPNCPAARAFVFSPDGSLAMAGSFRHGVYLFRLPAPGAAPVMAPLDPDWLKQTAPLPHVEMTREVLAKLKERNPGYIGQFLSNRGEDVTLWTADTVIDLAPMQAWTGLRSLTCTGSGPGKGKLADLSPLKDIKLIGLNCNDTLAADLSPLKDMKLTKLNVSGTRVDDLSLLKGMPLTELACSDTAVSSLTPLEGMKLTSLNCMRTKVSSLAPLKGMPLTFLSCLGAPVTDLSPLVGMPLKEIFVDIKTAHDAGILRSIPTLEKINGQDAKEVLKAGTPP